MIKLFGLILLSTLAFVVLTSCGETIEIPVQTTEPPIAQLVVQADEIEEISDIQKSEIPELELQIAVADTERLSTFSNLYEFFYPSAHGLGEDFITGYNIVIWSNVPLYDFAVITFGNDSLDGEFIFIPIDTFEQVDVLLPGDAFVLNSYYTKGTYPWSGITFNDENGVKRYFAINEGWPVIGDGELIIWEFENRTHELPPDWTPWWEVEPNADNYIVVYPSELPEGLAGFSLFLHESYTFKPHPTLGDWGWFSISDGNREHIMTIGQLNPENGDMEGMSESAFLERQASIYGAYEPPTEDFLFYKFPRFIGASDSLEISEIEMQRFYSDNRKGGLFFIQILLLPEEWEKGYDYDLIRAIKSFRIAFDPYT
jgi:hypothetical protein